MLGETSGLGSSRVVARCGGRNVDRHVVLLGYAEFGHWVNRVGPFRVPARRKGKSRVWA